MKYLKINYLLPVLAFVIFNSCSSLSVTSEADYTISYSNFKTYSLFGWADNSDKILNQLDKKRIENAFKDELSKRGLTYVESGGDLVLTLYIVTEQKQETTATSLGLGGYGGFYGYGPGYGWGGGMSNINYDTYDYTDGTLIIEIFDDNAKALIYESIGKKTIEENLKKREKSIPRVAATMMKDFPLKPVGKKK